MQCSYIFRQKLGCFYPPHIHGPWQQWVYYRDVLLKQEMLPDIRVISGDIFQQDSAPSQ